MRCVIIGLLSWIVLALPAPAQGPPEVKKAVDRAVAALRPLQHGDGSWGEYGPGSTSLVALALLEAGVPANDPAIVNAARYVRYQGLRSKHTYSVSLSIIFLDRITEKNDSSLIRLLTDRLSAGQLEDGGWSYHVPLGELGDLEQTIPAPAHPGGTIRRDANPVEGAASDNSNTQFGILALWVGRRHGAHIDQTLRKAIARFRRTVTPQVIGVGWGYTQWDRTGTGARTCCGLLGLALQFGSEIERRMKSAEGAADDKATPPPAARPDPLKDAIVQEAFRFVMREYAGETGKPAQPNDRPDYYFLWSFERVTAAYGLHTIYGIDWYRLGMRRILPFQEDNGLWTTNYGYEVDSSFALLFLCKSNLTRDLSNLLNPNKSPELKTDGKTPPAPPEPPPTSASLIKKFIDANADQRHKLIVEYRDKKGVMYTEALARLIPKVDNTWPKALRDALAARMARMTAATLRERLKDEDTEMRRAAAVACAMKDDKSLIPDLIAALDDREAWVVRACGVALARLTGQDFGPPPNATAAERAKAVAAWKEWWKKQKST